MKQVNRCFGMFLKNYQITIMDWLATTTYKIGWYQQDNSL
jgi:hypothetical protein